MYRNPANPVTAAGPGGSSGSGAAIQASELLARVRDAFPDFEINRFRLDDTGGDHALLIVNDTHAFRFPRAGMHSLDLEQKILRHLQTRLDLSTPRYDYVDPKRRFAGYRFIQGSELAPERFAQISEDKRTLLIADLATFLKTLHGLDPLAISPLVTWPLAWNMADYARRSLDERLSLFRSRLPCLAPAIAQFFEAYHSEQSSEFVVIHGDLVSEHMVFDESTKRLAGIIDFGDVALGDPAQDMLGCWAFGHEVVVQLIEHYGSDDAGLLARSRNHFIRYRIDRLFEQMQDGVPVAALGQQVSELEAHLSAFADKR